MKNSSEWLTNEWLNWFKLAVILYTIVLLLVGFSLAILFYNDNACEKDPLVYGINGMNRITKGNYTCSCTSDDINGEPFLVNEYEIKFKEHGLNSGLRIDTNS